VKHFKNSQQIEYATDRGNSYADRERNSPISFKEKPVPSCPGLLPNMTFSKREDLRNRITTAVARVDHDMLTRVWNEMDCRINVCRIAKGGYIERL
jgi:hypothetical protein